MLQLKIFFQQYLSEVGKCAKGMIISICIYIYIICIYDIYISQVDRSSSYSVGQYDLTH